MSSDSTKDKVRKSELLKQLLEKQIPDVVDEFKLKYSDLKRICQYINFSVFDGDECVLWDGYVTNSNNDNKGTYINFYFRGRKMALHRLLYSNFIGELSNEEYLKFNCPHKGACCNINHLKKFTYQKKPQSSTASDKEEDKAKTRELIGTDDGLVVDFEW